MLRDHYTGYTLSVRAEALNDMGGVTLTWQEKGTVQALLIPDSNTAEPHEAGMLSEGAGELLHEPNVTLPRGAKLTPVSGGRSLYVTGDDTLNRTPEDADEPAARVRVEWRSL